MRVKAAASLIVLAVLAVGAAACKPSESGQQTTATAANIGGSARTDPPRTATTRSTRRTATTVGGEGAVTGDDTGTTAGDSGTTVPRKSAQETLADLKAYLNENYPQTEWIGKLAGLKVSIQTAEDIADFRVGSADDENLTADEATAACKAVAEFIDQDFNDGEVVITDSNEKTLASRPHRDTPCVAA